MPLFLYGPLQDDILRDRVIGRSIAARPARLPDYEVRLAADGLLPVLVAGGSGVTGLLIDADAEALARIDAYQVAQGHVRAPVGVEVQGAVLAAETYLSESAPRIDAAYWDLAAWQVADGPISREAALEFDLTFGTMTPEAIAINWPMVRARAASRLRAAGESGHWSRRFVPREGDVERLGTPHLVGGFHRLADVTFRHRRFDGATSAPLRREVLNGVDAALVLPWDPASDHVLLVEQARAGPLVRGAPVIWSLEPVAGLIDAGETPEAAAAREAAEEAGLSEMVLHRMFGLYPSPGSSSDYFHCFAGVTSLAGHDGQIGGLAEENEDLRSHVLPLEGALALVGTGEIDVAPLVAMLYWLDRHREGLAKA